MPDELLVDLRAASVDLVVGPRRWTALAALDWQVARGERWVVLGPNGAGKSTLISLAAATRFPTTGAARVLGHELGRTDLRELRRGIGLVTARLGHDLDPRLTGASVVRTGPTSTWHVMRGHEDFDAQPWLDLVGAGSLAGRPWGQTSQGERARVLLARALAARPRLLILDEAAAGIDLVGRELLLAGLDSLAAQRTPEAWVHVTHHVEEIPASTTHALVLGPGRLVSAGPVDVALSSASMSEAFGIAVEVTGRAGERWSVRMV